MPKTVFGTHSVFSNSGYYQFQTFSRTRISMELKMLVDSVSKVQRPDGCKHRVGCVKTDQPSKR